MFIVNVLDASPILEFSDMTRNNRVDDQRLPTGITLSSHDRDCYLQPTSFTVGYSPRIAPHDGRGDFFKEGDSPFAGWFKFGRDAREGFRSTPPFVH
jgi:hypothetical protein